MDIATLIEGTGARLLDGATGSVRVCDLTDDSRSVMPGSLFVARPGSACDGRTFIADAIRAGAHAVLTTPDTPVPEAPGAPAKSAGPKKQVYNLNPFDQGGLRDLGKPKEVDGQ